MESCRYYDATNGWCKKLSDWRDAMPDIEYCIEGPCSYYEPKRNTITVDAKYNIGDKVFVADCYDGYYVPAGPYSIDCISVRVNRYGTQLSYGVHDDNDFLDFTTASEDLLFETYGECTEWCKKQNQNL